MLLHIYHLGSLRKRASTRFVVGPSQTAFNKPCRTRKTLKPLWVCRVTSDPHRRGKRSAVETLRTAGGTGSFVSPRDRQDVSPHTDSHHRRSSQWGQLVPISRRARCRRAGAEKEFLVPGGAGGRAERATLGDLLAPILEPPANWLKSVTTGARPLTSPTSRLTLPWLRGTAASGVNDRA
ncbi:hypothetical protein AAFF_G00320780 [Aldrovandia affinis]|uniref:Uncharacterized protein n=1 Tax=Aldrovandia affinis TaxID=143900 RepID=A0AAD7W0E2_9TELE|nr:hypothetical protein AAFF_G00320780 [Aldrovandia affinis]